MSNAEIPDGWKRALLAPLVALMFDRTDLDADLAWDQAVGFIMAYGPGTDQEFRLIVRMAICNLQANNASMMSNHPRATISQMIRLQANAIAFAKAADKAETRFKQLQTARTQSARAAQPVRETQPQPAAAASNEVPQPSKEAAKVISEYARKNNMTYAEAWGIYQRQMKAAQATSG
jgi:hypothetical protein